MTEAERQIARRQLVKGISIEVMIENLTGKSYGQLIRSHIERMGSQLPAGIAAHEMFVAPAEKAAVADALEFIDVQLESSESWPADAGEIFGVLADLLRSGVDPGTVDDAGIFNLFQLATLRFAERARFDPEFFRLITSQEVAEDEPREPIARSTGDLWSAIAEMDAGRLEPGKLFDFFQEAIDNGDIARPENEIPFVIAVLPLIDSGVLRSSGHVDELRARFNDGIRRIARGSRRKRFLKRAFVGVLLVLLAVFAVWVVTQIAP